MCGGIQCRTDNARVPSAATQIPPQIVADLLLGWIWYFVQQRVGHEYHVRRAKAALKGCLIEKRNLNGIEFAPVCQSLNRQNICPLAGDREGETRESRCAIYVNGAGSTLADPAPVFCSREEFIFTQDV